MSAAEELLSHRDSPDQWEEGQTSLWEVLFDDMEELYRDELQAAAEELEAMSLREVENRFEDVLTVRDEFEEGPHAVLLQIKISKDGILDLRHQHLDVQREGSIYDKPVSVSHYEEENMDPLDKIPFGNQDLNFVIRDPEILDPEKFKQSLFSKLVDVMTVESPSSLFLHPNLPSMPLK